MWRRLIVAFALCTSCVAHVSLPAPPPNLTADERVAWFESLSAASEVTTEVHCRKCMPSIDKELVLHDGTRVRAAEDLLPLVEPASPTAQHARASQQAREHADRWSELATGVVASALVVGLATDHTNPFADRTAAAILGPAAVIALFARVVAHDDANEATREAGIAFGTYSQDIAKRLEVCVHDLRLVRCETRVAGR
jgi:hypothetical protein